MINHSYHHDYDNNSDYRGAAEEILSFQAQLSRRLAAEMMVRQQVTSSYLSYDHYMIHIWSSYIYDYHHMIVIYDHHTPHQKSLSLQAVPASTLPYSQHEPRDWDIPRGLLYSLALITTIGSYIFAFFIARINKSSQEAVAKVSSLDLDVSQVWSTWWWETVKFFTATIAKSP